MQVFDIQVHVALPDDADEKALLEQLRYFAAELSGDPVGLPSGRGQAKVTLLSVVSVGPDASEIAAWNEEACRAVNKGDQLDLFQDMRGRVERRRPM